MDSSVKRLPVLLCSWTVIYLLSQEHTGYAQGEEIKKSPLNGLCSPYQFRCLNEKCIKRDWWCDGANDCGDNSDENYCKITYHTNCPRNYPFFRCKDNSRCIPKIWECNKVVDCLDGSDERECPNVVEKVGGSSLAKTKAVKWFLNQRNPNKTISKWGTQIHRIAVALYLADEKLFVTGNKIGEEITYELKIRLLGALLRDHTELISANEMALYVHALLVSCFDVRDFNGIDLVTTLRGLVEAHVNYTNPIVLLALCNARDTMTQNDVQKLTSIFLKSHRPYWTDTQALAIMALTCIAERTQLSFNSSLLKQLTSQLKSLQNRTGIIQSLHTTALVMQAVFASGEENGDEWDITDAIKYLVMSQSTDGSYENVLNSYYVLPVLSYKSLLNISSAHCKPDVKNDEVTTLDELRNKVGTKIRIGYSLWFGDNKDLVRSLEIRTVANTTFFDIMKLAAALDNKYRFKYGTLNSKPYVEEISGVQDDPESDTYWFLYKTDNFGMTLAFDSSPVDVVPKDKEELIMWYRTGDWNTEHRNVIVPLNETGTTPTW